MNSPCAVFEALSFQIMWVQNRQHSESLVLLLGLDTLYWIAPGVHIAGVSR